MAYLELDGITKAYDGRTVLHPTSLCVEKGEFVCFLGPSGGGKTTLLNCLCGVTEPSGGRVLLENDDITRMPLERRRFGVVFQQYALFPNLTAAENVAYGLRGMAPAERRRRVADMLRLVGLEDLDARLPGDLSGGQQQRVAVARALAPSPRLLLMDEPLSALDAQIRSRLGEDLRRLQRDLGITTIMVTHDRQEAFALADRIAVLHGGLLEQIGTPQELYAAPRSRFMAGFLGDMNILNAADGSPFGIRYEDVSVREAAEFVLKERDTFPARVEDIRHYGKFVRVFFLLQDMTTRVIADISAQEGDRVHLHGIMAVSFPQHRKIFWT